MRRLTLVPVVALLAAGLAACSAGNVGAAPSSASSASAAPSDCTPAAMQTYTSGMLTIGTDTPAYPPYFENNDPTNGQGLESALAYAVADKLGFAKAAVKWTVVPFNSSYAPGPKKFDFDINQISITPDRAKVVDFSEGYYTVNQAVVTLKTSKIANATSLAELQSAKLGAQVGTTSLSFITDYVKPGAQPYVYNDTNDAKKALATGQIDGIVVDLPTAYYITAAEIDNSKIVGLFPAQEGPTSEQFGMLFAKGSPLVKCIDWALASLKSAGTLKTIQDQWLAGADAPYFKQ